MEHSKPQNVLQISRVYKLTNLHTWDTASQITSVPEIRVPSISARLQTEAV